jgi:anti-sigma regulatory factor (Ser/Thr protein kinase)
MDFKHHTSFHISDRSYISLIKREIHKIASGLNFSENAIAEIDIIASELTSNIVKHAGARGEILVKALNSSSEYREEKITGIEIISIDSGPGMDVARMMKDGVSTTNTLGQGLGAIKRLSHEFDLYSMPGWGTVVLSRYFLEYDDTYKAPTEGLTINTIMVPKPGETVSGDGGAYKLADNKFYLLVCDGLGHGPDARTASAAAERFFSTANETEPSEILAAMHPAVKYTRGAVATVLRYDNTSKELSCCGIGNISSRIICYSGNKTFMSYNGTVGLNRPSVLHDQKMKIDDLQYIIVTSDGLKTRWELTKYVNIWKHDNSILAAVLYKDFSRRTDDSLVVVVSKKK